MGVGFSHQVCGDPWQRPQETGLRRTPCKLRTSRPYPQKLERNRNAENQTLQLLDGESTGDGGTEVRIGGSGGVAMLCFPTRGRSSVSSDRCGSRAGLTLLGGRERVSEVARHSALRGCARAGGEEDCGSPAEPQRPAAPTDQEPKELIRLLEARGEKRQGQGRLRPRDCTPGPGGARRAGQGNSLQTPGAWAWEARHQPCRPRRALWARAGTTETLTGKTRPRSSRVNKSPGASVSSPAK